MVVVPGSRAEAAAAAAFDRTPRPVVLVIERQALFRAALSRLLSGPPIMAHVQVVNDSKSGLELARLGGIHLAFCDAGTWPIPASDLARELSALAPAVPLILLGDRDEEEVMSLALQGQVAGLFTKDCPLDEFLSGVKAVLSGHRVVGANLMGHMLDRLATKTKETRRAGGSLSPTELAILAQVGKARSISYIAASRGISPKTVRNHLASIYRKLDLRSRTEAMLCAARMGLTAE